MSVNAVAAIIAALGSPRGKKPHLDSGVISLEARYNREMLLEAGATFNKDERYWQLRDKKLSEEAATFNGPDFVREFIGRAKETL
jgi:hypothetical protein